MENKEYSEQDYTRIADELRDRGLPEKEVWLRIDTLRLSNSEVGVKGYDPYSNSWPTPKTNEPKLLELPKWEDSPTLEETGQVKERTESNGQKKIHLPLEMYGQLANKVVMAMSNGFLVNPDLISATMLVAVGMAANRKTIVRIGNYTNTPSIWLCVVEQTGGNKSEPIARILKPLESINQDLIERTSQDYAAWKESGEKGTPPPQRKIIISDSTPEVRNVLLNNNGLLLYRDEINGFLRDLNRYNQSGEVETLLTIWSNTPYAVDRKTSTCFYVENPFLCICGGIQPEVIRSAFGGKNFEGSGFLARWLFLWLTDSKVPDRINEVLIDKEIENEWFNLIQDLWRMPAVEYRLNQNAAQVYQEYMMQTANIMNDGCEFGTRATLGKLRVYALRIALIIHLLQYGKDAAEEIDEYTMTAAVKTCDAFEIWNAMTVDAVDDKEASKKIDNADLLRELVKRYNITNQSELARLIGKSQQYVSRILNGK